MKEYFFVEKKNSGALHIWKQLIIFVVKIGKGS